MKKLGDPHNFGKFVFQEDERIFKPRTIFWEYLFLSSSSPLRSYIDQCATAAGTTSPFAIAPDLKFKFKNFNSGWVEKLVLASLPSDLEISSENARAIGCLAAMAFWFGLGDLHAENVVTGLDPAGRLILFPIDIECIFDHLVHVDQTLLLPRGEVSNAKCGMGKIWPHLLKADTDTKFCLLTSFLDLVNACNSHSKEILEILLGLPNIESSPIRVIPRDTETYQTALLKNCLEDFYQSERTQLSRGEIPYFFRSPSSLQIFYFSKPDVQEIADFSYASFRIPAAIPIAKCQAGQFIRLKSTVLSVGAIATALNLSAESRTLGESTISDGCRYLRIEESNGKILYNKY